MLALIALLLGGPCSCLRGSLSVVIDSVAAATHGCCAALAHLAARDKPVFIRMQALGRVSGRVVDGATHEPIGGFQVRLRYYHGWEGWTEPSDSRSGPSGVPGEFTLTSVRSGEYVVEGSAAGYAPSYSVPFYVAQGQEITSVEVPMTLGGTLTGRVLDPQGAPIYEVQVRAEDDEYVETHPFHTRWIVCGWSTDATSREVLTDSSGRFVLSHLHPATYKLIVSADGYGDKTIKAIAVCDGRIEDFGVLWLNRSGTLSGTLRDATGAPIASGIVELEPARTESGLHRHHRTRTAADGSFRIEGISPGRYLALNSQSPADERSFARRWDEAWKLDRYVTLRSDEVITCELAIGH